MDQEIWNIRKRACPWVGSCAISPDEAHTSLQVINNFLRYERKWCNICAHRLHKEVGGHCGALTYKEITQGEESA